VVPPAPARAHVISLKRLCSLTPTRSHSEIATVMPSDLSKTPTRTQAAASQLQVRKATVASISSQPKVSTAQALRGYEYLRSRSSRGNKSHRDGDLGSRTVTGTE
jgi:hypothetical protein